jgi:hypothetical protein
MMAIRHHIGATNRTAATAARGAVLILGGLLLLIVP